MAAIASIGAHPGGGPQAVVVMCGKRKTGKDYVAARLVQMYVVTQSC